MDVYVFHRENEEKAERERIERELREEEERLREEAKYCHFYFCSLFFFFIKTSFARFLCYWYILVLIFPFNIKK